MSTELSLCQNVSKTTAGLSEPLHRRLNVEHFTSHPQYKHSGRMKYFKSYKPFFFYPHSNNSTENATPLWSIQLWHCYSIRQHISNTPSGGKAEHTTLTGNIAWRCLRHINRETHGVTYIKRLTYKERSTNSIKIPCQLLLALVQRNNWLEFSWNWDHSGDWPFYNLSRVIIRVKWRVIVRQVI